MERVVRKPYCCQLKKLNALQIVQAVMPNVLLTYLFFSLNQGKHFSVKIIFTCTHIITFNNNNICIFTYNNNSSCKTCKHSRLTNRFTCTSRHKLEYNLSTGLTRTCPLNAQHNITGHHLAVLKIFYMYKSTLKQLVSIIIL